MKAQNLPQKNLLTRFFGCKNVTSSIRSLFWNSKQNIYRDIIIRITKKVLILQRILGTKT